MIKKSGGKNEFITGRFFRGSKEQEGTKKIRINKAWRAVKG